MKIRCMKCKESKEIENPNEVIKNGTKLFQSPCPDCDTPMTRFGGKIKGATKKVKKDDGNNSHGDEVFSFPTSSPAPSPDKGNSYLKIPTIKPIEIDVGEAFRTFIVSFFVFLVDLFGHSRRQKAQLKQEIEDAKKEVSNAILERDRQEEFITTLKDELEDFISQTNATIEDNNSVEHFERVILNLDKSLKDNWERMGDYLTILSRIQKQIKDSNQEVINTILEVGDKVDSFEVTYRPSNHIDPPPVEKLGEDEVEEPPTEKIEEKEFSELEPHDILGVTAYQFSQMDDVEKIRRFFITQGSMKFKELVKPIKSSEIADMLNMSPQTFSSHVDEMRRYFGEHLDVSKKGKQVRYLLDNSWDFEEIARQEAKRMGITTDT